MRAHPIDGDASAIQPTAREEVILSLFYKKGSTLNPFNFQKYTFFTLFNTIEKCFQSNNPLHGKLFAVTYFFFHFRTSA
jgi:hypothetical protein